MQRRDHLGGEHAREGAAVKLVVFGLTISSSWGNGRAASWRALAGGLAREGHRLVFFERDLPWYAPHRDQPFVPGGTLHLYDDWESVRSGAVRELSDADAAMVTSCCPDGVAACELVLASRVPVRSFYDMDAAVTLARLAAGESVAQLPSDGLARFDLVLSSAGGRALDALVNELGARQVAPLYGSVDPDVHGPVVPSPEFTGDCSYLGNYAADREQALRALFLEAADRLPHKRFVIGGSQYPEALSARENVRHVEHVARPLHGAFYCSSPITVSVTRAPAAAMGHCPSRRLFEAAACGTAVLSDAWEGLDRFFEPDHEILVAKTAEEAAAILASPREELAIVARAARQRALAQHTGWHRARELVELLVHAA